MIRNPIFTFDNILSTGVDKIPLNTVVVINDVSGVVKRIHVHDLTGITSASTIEDLLDGTVGDYTESEERGGLLWYQPASYLVGDTVSLGGELFISLTDHLSAVGDVPTGDPTQPLQTSWSASIGSTERGGLIWNDVTNYLIGDVVSIDASIWVALTDNINISPVDGTDWQQLEYDELGGTAWGTLRNYIIGDLITESGIVYQCIVSHLSADFITDAANWEEVASTPERGGIAWDITTNYAKGDIVVDLSNFSTYKANINNNLGNVPSDPLSGWDPIVDPELGGLPYDATLRYPTGAIVTENEITYIAIVDTALNQPPSTHPGKYKVVGEERGGIAWNTTAEYIIGDIVYDTINDTPYVAIVTPVTDHVLIPSLNLLEWKAITGTSGSMLTADYRFSILTTGDPGSGNASCNNADNTLADVLFISDLDEDGIDRTYGLENLDLGDYVNYRDKGNDPDTYIYRVIGDSIDQGTYFEVPVIHHTSIGAGGLADTERMNVEVLYLSQAIPERGGVSWKTSTNYLVGDIVMSDHSGPGMWKQYYCNTSHTSTTAVADELNWTIIEGVEKGGILWDTTLDYVVGDIVSFDDKVFQAIVDNTNVSPVITGTTVTWRMVNPDQEEEIGGVLWQGNTEYFRGTIVSVEEGIGTFKQYYCLNLHTSSPTFTTDAANWQELAGSEQGGVFYKSMTTYEVGDIITADDGTSSEVYRCITGYTSAATGLPSDFLLEIANWSKIESTVATMLQATYTFGTATAGNPPSGYAQINNIDPTLANEVHISEDDNNGVDKSYGLQSLRIGDWIAIIDTNSNTSYSYHITADPIDMGGWYKIQGSYHKSTGTFVNNEDVFVEVLFVHKNQEQGGVFYQGSTAYNVGDIISADDGTDISIYRCLVSYTSAPNGLPVDFVPEIGNWLKLDTPHGYINEVNQAVFTPAEGSNDFFDYGFTQDALIDTMIGLNAGDTGTIVVRQDTVGGWLATWAAEYIFPSGLPVLGVNPFDVDIFDYYVLSPIHVVVEFVSSLNIPIIAPIAITDFDATDAETNQITFTFTETPGETYDLYDSVGLVQAGIVSGDNLPITGTENYFVKSINLAGTADSNIDSGTGILVNIVVITDFNASDNQYNQVTMTWTETVGETYDLYNTAGLVQAGVSTGYIYTVDGMDDYYVKSIIGGGSEDSNIESGEGLVVLIAITDFNATDGDATFVTVTFTPQP